MSFLSLHNEPLYTKAVARIEDFVYDRTSKFYSTKIRAYALRKALSRYVQKKYGSRGVYVEYAKNKIMTIFKKTKKFKQADFVRGFAVPQLMSLADNHEAR